LQKYIPIGPLRNLQAICISMPRNEMSACGSSGDASMSKKPKSEKRERKQKLAPVLRRKLPRLKKRPRGKSFEPGNSYGLATRFKKGNRANPGGRPSYKKYSEALRALVAADPDETFEINSNAAALAARVVKMGKKGNISAIREIGDRCEGRPAITVHSDGSPDQITLLVEAMTERSREIGHPEGWVPPLLESGVDEEHEEQEEVNDGN